MKKGDTIWIVPTYLDGTGRPVRVKYISVSSAAIDGKSVTVGKDVHRIDDWFYVRRSQCFRTKIEAFIYWEDRLSKAAVTAAERQRTAVKELVKLVAGLVKNAVVTIDRRET